MAGLNVAWSPQPGSQNLFLISPIHELLYQGTRGPGKTDALLMDYAQYVNRGYGADWRGVLFRQTYKQLSDIIARSQKWFRQIFPQAEYNRAEHTWTFPAGEQLLLRYMDSPDDYWNYHGHEYPWIGWEELTNWSTSDCYESMKACCRSSNSSVPRHYRATANPYGRGHNWVKNFFIDVAPPGRVFRDTNGQCRAHVFGRLEENKFLTEADPEYVDRLAADTNEMRRQAWLHGNWDITAGGIFDDLWIKPPNPPIIEPFEIPACWTIDRSFDWGSAKPFCVLWWAESDGTEAPNGIVYPARTLFLIHEWYGCEEGRTNVGVNMLNVDIARGILRREEEWGIKTRVSAGPADTQIFSRLDGLRMADSFESLGVYWKPANKAPGSRVAGVESMRERLAASRQRPMEAPGLWVFNTCRQFLRTVPVLPRSEKNPDDVDTTAEDHVWDAAMYRLLQPNYGHSGVVV